MARTVVGTRGDGKYGGSRYLNARRMVGTGHWRVGPAGLIFIQISETAKICKFKTAIFRYSNHTQILYEAIIKYSEQLLQLGQLQIPNINHVINSGTNSNLNILRILQGFKPSEKILRNFPKFSFHLIFTKVNLAGHTCMKEILRYDTGVKWLGSNKRKEFEFQIQTSQHF
jgi:hypothetical protein